MTNALMEMLAEVKDERTFVRFLSALRADCEASKHNCEARYDDCVPEHWQSKSTVNFLRSMEEWAGGDFVEGEHGDDPILRRVATMLYVGRYLRNEDMPPRWQV
jgi:hypothetical protein